MKWESLFLCRAWSDQQLPIQQQHLTSSKAAHNIQFIITVFPIHFLWLRPNSNNEHELWPSAKENTSAKPHTEMPLLYIIIRIQAWCQELRVPIWSLWFVASLGKISILQSAGVIHFLEHSFQSRLLQGYYIILRVTTMTFWTIKIIYRGIKFIVYFYLLPQHPYTVVSKAWSCDYNYIFNW